MNSEIVEGVWQLKIPLRYNALEYTYCYLLVDESILIDAGEESTEAQSALNRQLTKAGLKASDIERVILTHLHRDHIGLLGYIKHVSGAEIYAHEKALGYKSPSPEESRKLFENMKREMKMLGGGEFLRFLSRFEGSFRTAIPGIQVDKALSDGESITHDLKVIWTPGHAREHICLYDEGKRALYSGDHVLPSVTSHVSLHTYETGDPLRDYLESLEKIRGLEVSKVLPAHEYVFEGLEERINQLKEHHETRLMEIKEALGNEQRTVFQVSSKVSWKSQPWPLMPFWVKRMAAAETLAHLAYLRNRGELEEKILDDVLYYKIRK